MADTIRATVDWQQVLAELDDLVWISDVTHISGLYGPLLQVEVHAVLKMTEGGNQEAGRLADQVIARLGAHEHVAVTRSDLTVTSELRFFASTMEPQRYWGAADLKLTLEPI